MAKVLLVNPALAYSDWKADLKKPSPDSVFIRLGLAYLAGALKAKGHEVSLADLRTLSGWREFTEIVKKVSPDFVGISMHSVEFSIAVEAAKTAKKALPGITVIAGGIHPTMFPQECLDTGVFDYVLQGEGEISLPMLVENPSNFPRYFWGETPNLDEIPFPDREIWTDYKNRMCSEPFGISKYRFPLPMAEIINVRGCPYNCSFCCGPGEHQLYTKLDSSNKRIPNIRGRSVSNVIAEVEMLIEKYGIRSAMFHDDQFIMSPKWVKEFIDELHKRGIVKSGFKWVTSSRADIICRNEELVREMAGAGLEMLIVGFESFSPRILKWFHKGVESDQNFKAAEICKKFNIKIWANYILGIRTDTGWHKEDDILTVAGVLKVDPVHYSPALYTPVPGSKLFSFYKENGLIEGSYTSVEDLSNRGKMASKIKGVDYSFLDSIMITDAIFSSDADIKDAMKCYLPEKNGMEDLEYISAKSIDAAAGIIKLFQKNISGLVSNYNQLAGQADGMIRHANSKAEMFDKTIRGILNNSIKVEKIVSKNGAEAIDSKVSVVIPVKNGGRQLESLLAKIRKQKKVSAIEIIIVDSGSTDNTVQTSLGFGAKVLEIPSKEFNHGASRQLGVDAATGEFIALTVHDACPTSDYWLYKMVKCFMDNPELSVVSARQMGEQATDLYSRWVLDSTYRTYGLMDDIKYGLKYADLFDCLPENIRRTVSFVDDVCACYRADVIKKMKFAHLSNAEDIDMGVRLVKAGHRLGFMYTAGVTHWHSDGPDYFLKRHFNGVKSFVQILGNELKDLEQLYINSFDDIRLQCATLYHAIRLALQEWNTNGILTDQDIRGFVDSVHKATKEFSRRYKNSNGSTYGNNNELKALLDDLGCTLNNLNGDNPIKHNHLIVEFSGQLTDLIKYILENRNSLKISRDDFSGAIYKIIASRMGDLIGNWVMKLKKEGRQKEINDIENMLSKGVCYS